MKRLIIAFGHRRERGKNTASLTTKQFLKDRYVREDSFARSLKETCKAVFSFSEEQVNGKLKGVTDEYWGFTPRWALQTVGTELFRQHIDPAIWAKSLVRRIMLHPEHHFLITDLRFTNEAEAIKACGGFVVRCDRDIPFDPEIDSHQSEIDLLNYTNWDFIIDNNGSFEDLSKQIKTMIKTMLYL